MVNNPEIKKRIDRAIDRAEKSIVAAGVKDRRGGQTERVYVNVIFVNIIIRGTVMMDSLIQKMDAKILL